MAQMAHLRLDNTDQVHVMLWADPDQPGIFWDQPPGDLPGYRKPRKYTEADRLRLEQTIGEDVQIIRPGDDVQLQYSG